MNFFDRSWWLKLGKCSLLLLGFSVVILVMPINVWAHNSDSMTLVQTINGLEVNEVVVTGNGDGLATGAQDKKTGRQIILTQTQNNDNTPARTETQQQDYATQERYVTNYERSVYFTMDFKPLSLLYSPEVENFKVVMFDSHDYGYYYGEDDVVGSGSFFPSIKAGIGINTPVMYIDITGGLGYLFNGAFRSPMYIGDLALRFKLGQHVTFGPHFGVVGFSPEWNGTGRSSSDDVQLDSKELGFMGGLAFTAGGRVASFSMSIDYLNASFDVTTQNGWVANTDKLDISGYVLNLGVIFRF